VKNLNIGSPLLIADPERTNNYKKLLGELPAQFNVGIAWKGGVRYLESLKRSIDFSELLPILLTPNVNFINLQKGNTQSEESGLKSHGIQLHRLNNEDGSDLEDLAALVSSLDLVVTVDSTVAHIAGALGKPVWLLTPKIPEWRWLLYTDQSPWYPSITLFRQTETDRWREPVAKASGALKDLIVNQGK